MDVSKLEDDLPVRVFDLPSYATAKDVQDAVRDIAKLTHVRVSDQGDVTSCTARVQDPHDAIRNGLLARPHVLKGSGKPIEFVHHIGKRERVMSELFRNPVSRSVLVTGVGPSVSEEELHAYFACFGAVEAVTRPFLVTWSVDDMVRACVEFSRKSYARNVLFLAARHVVSECEVAVEPLPPTMWATHAQVRDQAHAKKKKEGDSRGEDPAAKRQKRGRAKGGKKGAWRPPVGDRGAILVDSSDGEKPDVDDRPTHDSKAKAVVEYAQGAPNAATVETQSDKEAAQAEALEQRTVVCSAVPPDVPTEFVKAFFAIYGPIETLQPHARPDGYLDYCITFTTVDATLEALDIGYAGLCSCIFEVLQYERPKAPEGS